MPPVLALPLLVYTFQAQLLVGAAMLYQQRERCLMTEDAGSRATAEAA